MVFCCFRQSSEPTTSVYRISSDFFILPINNGRTKTKTNFNFFVDVLWSVFPKIYIQIYSWKRFLAIRNSPILKYFYFFMYWYQKINIFA